jgi:cytochrome P450
MYTLISIRSLSLFFCFFPKTSDGNKALRKFLDNTLSGNYKQNTGQAHPTIFAEFLNNNLPPEEKTEARIMDNASLLVGSGFETTSYTLNTAHYHLLANPDMTLRLKKELQTIWPEDGTIPPWTTLERLPYFKAVITESLRMSMGAMTRLSRVNHHESIHYGEWEIPKHTPVGMSQFLIHYNDNLFPDPWKFDPERWLRGEKSKQLEKHVVAFSKGSRGCIGQQYVKLLIFLPNIC